MNDPSEVDPAAPTPPPGPVEQAPSRIADGRRRGSRLLWAAIPIVLLAAALSVPEIPGTGIRLSVPFVAQGPGPAVDTLGEVDGEPVIVIEGAEPQETGGELRMTTVSVRSEMTLPQALGRWLFSEDEIVPVEQVFPQGQNPEEIREANQVAFADSEAAATVAALNHLGRPLQVEVAALVEDSPAAGRLEEGDRIVAVGGTEVDRPGEVRDAVRAHRPGDIIAIRVLRGGEGRTVEVRLGEAPGGEGAAFLGIAMSSSSADGIEVTYNLSDVGGPSAGLIFSLAVVDKLTPGELTGGLPVAGTGTIAEDGTVGPIGGIRHKVTRANEVGSRLFLAPRDNCAEALEGSHEHLIVAPVDTLDGAIATMADVAAGRDVETCS